MKISRFQLRLTIIFLIVLLVPAIIATFFTRYIITIEKTGIDVDQKVEDVLQESSEIAYEIIENSSLECQSIAEAIANHNEIFRALRSQRKIKELISQVVPSDSDLTVTVFRTNGNIYSLPVFFTTSANSSFPEKLISNLRQQTSPSSYHEGEMVYGISPILADREITGFIVVSKQLKHKLVKSIVDLQNLLSVYALREDIENLIWVGLLGLILVLAILGVLFAAILARNVTKPILNLVNGMKEVSKGNLDYRVEVKGKDEIATLEESFNLMIGQLKSSRERLMLAERLAAWRDVARRIAHEIKNPLTPIQLSMYRLKKNLGSEKYEQIFDDCYNSITKEVENLRNMVTEFSNFARMPKPRTAPSNINEIIENSLKLYTGLPENIKINKDMGDNFPLLMIDGDQMRQVFHNLIGNSIDAMPNGGEINIKTYLEDHSVVIEIADTGCGMPEDVRQKIFTPYFTTKEKGTGLGMSIVAQIIEEHGGEIFVDSKEGTGTKVTIRLIAKSEEGRIV